MAEPTPQKVSARQRRAGQVKGPKYSGKPVPEGVLAGHYKSGRTYKPPLLAIEGSLANDWAKDDLPDLLWPLVTAHLLASGAAKFWREAQHRLLQGFGTENAPIIDGRLSSMELLEPEQRDTVAKVVAADAAQLLMLPEVVGVLRLFGGVLPGAWFVDALVPHFAEIPDTEASLEVLRESIISVLADRHLNALTKAPTINWSIITGKLHAVEGTLDALINWPMDKEMRSHGDAVILSSFLGEKQFAITDNPSLQLLRSNWTTTFWSKASSMTPCLLETTPNDYGFFENVDQDYAQASTSSLQVLDTSYQRFIDDFFSHDLDVEHPSRHEVVSGLVRRAYRQLRLLLDDTRRWTSEFADAEMRSLSELRITLMWLHAKDDSELFRRYQSFGHGRRKLYTAHARAIQVESGTPPTDDFVELIRQLDEREGNWQGGEFQEVSTENVFGITTRNMADEIGEMAEYNIGFQMASGVLHNEWWAIEDHCLQRCLEPLHRFHWVPGPSHEITSTPEFGAMMAARFEHIVNVALAILEPENRNEGQQ